MTPPLVLASASERRRDLLAHFGVPFTSRPADLDETPRPDEPAREYVVRLAREKALAVARPGEVVIAADTTIDLDGLIVGKPLDDADARHLLRSLSGRDHLVHTGVAVALDGDVRTAVETTVVAMAGLRDADIDWYVATGEPTGKAGAYALQGKGSMFVTSITGSVSNVIGLPLNVVIRLCGDQKIEVLGASSRRFGDD